MDHRSHGIINRDINLPMVWEEDGQVVLRRNGLQFCYAPARARRVAFRLSVGADVARVQGHDMDPSRYHVPGTERMTHDEATFIARELFNQACELELLADQQVSISGAECVTVMVGANKVRFSE